GEGGVPVLRLGLLLGLRLVEGIARPIATITFIGHARRGGVLRRGEHDRECGYACKGKETEVHGAFSLVVRECMRVDRRGIGLTIVPWYFQSSRWYRSCTHIGRPTPLAAARHPRESISMVMPGWSVEAEAKSRLQTHKPLAHLPKLQRGLIIA